MRSGNSRFDESGGVMATHHGYKNASETRCEMILSNNKLKAEIFIRRNTTNDFIRNLDSISNKCITLHDNGILHLSYLTVIRVTESSTAKVPKYKEFTTSAVLVRVDLLLSDVSFHPERIFILNVIAYYNKI